MPELKITPPGLATIWYGEEVLHRLGTWEIIGAGGLYAVICIVLVVGQFTRLGVTTTVYITVLGVPGGITGVMIVLEPVVTPPNNQVLGVHEYEYCVAVGGGVKEIVAPTLPPGHREVV